LLYIGDDQYEHRESKRQSILESMNFKYAIFMYCKIDYDKKIAIISLGGELYGH
jgi:hypothetical protein